MTGSGNFQPGRALRPEVRMNKDQEEALKRQSIHRKFPDAHTVDCKLHSPSHVIRAEAKIPEQLWNFLVTAIPLNERFTQSELRELDMLRDRILVRGKSRSGT